MAVLNTLNAETLHFAEAAAPSTPDAAEVVIYAKSDGLMYSKDDAGTETLMSSGPAGAGGAILQVVRANSTTLDSTTSATLQASSLSCAITPTADDSLLIIEVDGVVQAARTSGSPQARSAIVAIQNTTNSVQVCQQSRGQSLVATSDQTANTFSPIALKGYYTVNSTASRTFQLQFASGEASLVTVFIRGTDTGGVSMTITEVAA